MIFSLFAGSETVVVEGPIGGALCFGHGYDAICHLANMSGMYLWWEGETRRVTLVLGGLEAAD